MARTHLFRALRRVMREAGVGPVPNAVSRRTFLALSAAAAACSPQTGGTSLARGARGVGIVGGGAAGLVVAYRLSQQSLGATLYEASDRWGGRIFTRRNFNEDNQFCELGGELVDTNHEALRNLAQELGVAIDRLAPEDDPGQEIYHIVNRLYAQRDMIGPTGEGAFKRAAERIAVDQAALLDAQGEWTARARELDSLSVRQYLDSIASLMPAWAVTLLDIAYAGEYGIPTNQQSAINLIYLIGTDTKEGFDIFGESDEAFRIRGGSSSLIEALQTKLSAQIAQRPRHVLTRIARIDNGVRLTFDTPSGSIDTEHDAVVLALPFTKLREVQGIDTLEMSDLKLQAIRELGYGANSKIMISTTSRPWARANNGLPTPSTGTFYSDSGMQIVWETSRGQPGERGILTNFLAGVDEQGALARLTQGLRRISPAIADSLDASKVATMFWPRQPFVMGSYAGAKVGQYTSLCAETATPALGGRIQFAGEHTSEDFMGFMNGAVESGERVAQALLG